ncbi:transmembrane protein 225B isoform X4 [Lynx canadensis]|uniref:transmembrane protein 225B isoform X4 n=1 Tax=Lynx canadensis TaxID=61383 RepID=UPI0013C423D7|nr:transmembrane protein 225B isoform X4 [Lynx canadensis]
MAELEFELRSAWLEITSTPFGARGREVRSANSPGGQVPRAEGQVMLTLEDKDMKGFTWAIAPALTSLGYLLILLVSIFPFWVRLVNEESHEVFFSGLFENCFHIKCWKPRPLSGASAFLALLLHALEIQNLRMKPSPPKFSVQWPYYVLGFAILLFIVAGAICLFQEAACLRCRLLPNSQSIQETQGVIHLENMESLGGDLSSIQKETLLKEETII